MWPPKASCCGQHLAWPVLPREPHFPSLDGEALIRAARQPHSSLTLSCVLCVLSGRLDHTRQSPTSPAKGLRALSLCPRRWCKDLPPVEPWCFFGCYSLNSSAQN